MKVLIVSHNCFSTIQSMGKTFISLFSQFDKSELMQLYLYPSTPNVDICEDYFRITDREVINSIIKRRRCGGKIQAQLDDDTTQLFDSSDTEKQYTSMRRSGEIARRARDAAWKLGAWRSKELKRWLAEGKPDVVFYALGNASFSQNVAMWVAKYLDIPLVTYVCDEFYFSGKKERASQRLINCTMLANMKKTLKRSSLIVSICDKLGKEYEEAFSVPYKTIMTGASFEVGALPHVQDKPAQISYIGGLGLNRYKSLLEIQAALDKYNAASEQKYELVYYGDKYGEVEGKVSYGGLLNSEGVKRVMAESSVLLHIETFEPEFKDRLKYSISTKIADSLASGTCLLAYGPADIASIEHLLENDCAYCITHPEELEEKLKALLDSPEMAAEYALRGIEVAKEDHSSDKNSVDLHKALEDVCSQCKK